MNEKEISILVSKLMSNDELVKNIEKQAYAKNSPSSTVVINSLMESFMPFTFNENDFKRTVAMAK